MAGPSAGNVYQGLAIHGGNNILGNYYAGSRDLGLLDRHQKNLSLFFEGTTDSRIDREEHLIRRSNRADGTCEWIKVNKAFQNWQAGEEPLLWISGGPGKGKTFLSMYITEVLESYHDGGVEPRPTCLEFYCNNRYKSRNNVNAIIKGLIRNILRRKKVMIKHLLDAFEHAYEATADISRFGGLWQVLYAMLSDDAMGVVYCIIDGFDECDDLFREEMLRRLKGLTVNGQDRRPSRIRVLITSRDLPRSLSAILSSGPHLCLDRRKRNSEVINAINEDLRRLIAVKMDSYYPEDKYPGPWRAKLADDLLRKSEGTFLWIGFAMEIIKDQALSEIPDTLSRLPGDLPQMYAQMLSQILPSRREIAANIFRWVSAATSPLTLIQLHEAVMPPKTSLPSSHLKRVSIEREMRDWVGFCGHLLAVDDSGSDDDETRSSETGNWSGDCVTFVHQSAKDYLLRISSDGNDDPFHLDEKEINSYVTKRCISYMQTSFSSKLLVSKPMNIARFREERSGNVRDLISSPEETSEYLQKMSMDFPLLRYCIFNWVNHARLADNSVYDLREPFFAEESQCRSLWFRTHTLMSRHFYIPKSSSAPAGIDLIPSSPVLLIAARLGLAALLSLLLDKAMEQLSMNQASDKNDYLEQRSVNGNTALMFAASYGHLEAAKLLLDRGADINARSSSGLSALLHAGLTSQNQVIELFLEKGAEIGLSTTDTISPTIDNPALDAYKRIIDYLSRTGKGVSRWIRAKNGTIPLWLAIHMRNRSITDLLLQNGVSIEEKDHIGNTPLALAAANEDISLLKELLRRGADVNTRNNAGETPLILAASLMSTGGRSQCMEMLVDAHSNIEACDNEGRTALQKATNFGYRDNVACLVRLGANREQTRR